MREQATVNTQRESYHCNCQLSYLALPQRKISHSWESTSEKDTEHQHSIPAGGKRSPCGQGSQCCHFTGGRCDTIGMPQASNGPLHWQDAVRQGSERDVRLEVIERAPLNTPVKFQSIMVCTPKHDISLQGTVGYNVVNIHYPQQTLFTPSP